MRRLCILMLVACMAQYSNAQPPSAQHMISTVSNVPNSEMFKDRRTYYFYDDSYMIDGHQVLGHPFLYHDWSKGIITTADGKVFSNYKIKYNAYNQTVLFSDGKDSLEVNEEIKEFVIVNVYPDTTVTSKFINAGQLKKEKKTFYYEVLLDDAAGTLLKYNRKTVAESAEGIPAAEGKKIFRLESSVFYFDKAKKTVTPIKANGSNVISLLNLDDAAKTALQPKGTDFSIETNVVHFFKKYFEWDNAKQKPSATKTF